MKKIFLFVLSFYCIFCSACKQKTDYDQKISQLRTDVFVYECQNFTLTAFSEIVETPLTDDGVKGKTEKLITFRLRSTNSNYFDQMPQINFTLADKNYSANFEFKQIPTILSCSVNVDDMPSSAFDISLRADGTQNTITLQSVKNSTTKSYNQVLKSLLNDQSFLEIVSGQVEIRIRLIHNDGYDYWYVGLITPNKTISYLLDGETLEIIAKKDN